MTENQSQISAIIKIQVAEPFKKTMRTLLDFTMVWHGRMLCARSKTGDATISLPQEKFKKIFNENPRVKPYNIPVKLKFFVKKAEVIEVKAT